MYCQIYSEEALSMMRICKNRHCIYMWARWLSFAGRIFMKKKQIIFRIDETLKELFQNKLRDQELTMSEVLSILINDYIFKNQMKRIIDIILCKLILYYIEKS